MKGRTEVITNKRLTCSNACPMKVYYGRNYRAPTPPGEDVHHANHLKERSSGVNVCLADLLRPRNSCRGSLPQLFHVESHSGDRIPTDDCVNFFIRHACESARQELPA